jgi:hypothetical protein
MNKQIHKNNNVPLILIVCHNNFCMLERQIIGHFLGLFEGVLDFLRPLIMPNYVFCPHK